MAEEEPKNKEQGAREVEEEKELSALDLPGRKQELPEIRLIPLEEIHELENIRSGYHGIEGLAEAIYQEGQLQPCLVRPAPPDAPHGKPWELVFGYRRKRAIEYLRDQGKEGWDKLRCIVQEVKGDEQLAKMIVENFHREELSPVAEARAMWALKHSTDPPLSNAEVARRLGCHRSHVTHRLSLLELALPEAQKPAGLLGKGTETEGEQARVEQAERKEAGGDEAAGAGPKGGGKGPAPAEHEIRVGEDEGPAAGEDGDAGRASGQERRVDILEMVDRGEIPASSAEVIVSLDNREDQEKLAMLIKRHGWSQRRAAAWARKVKAQREEEASGNPDPEAVIEPISVGDVTQLPRLSPREITDEERERLALYVILRNGMDREMLDYLDEEMGVPFNALWPYVEGLPLEDVRELTRRLVLRYISAAHRYHDLEPELRERFEAQSNDERAAAPGPLEGRR